MLGSFHDRDMLCLPCCLCALMAHQQFGLLMFFRIYLLLRFIRDHSDVYRNRHMLTRNVYADMRTAPPFGAWLAVKTLFYRVGCVAVIRMCGPSLCYINKHAHTHTHTHMPSVASAPRTPSRPPSALLACWCLGLATLSISWSERRSRSSSDFGIPFILGCSASQQVRSASRAVLPSAHSAQQSNLVALHTRSGYASDSFNFYVPYEKTTQITCIACTVSGLFLTSFLIGMMQSC